MSQTRVSQGFPKVPTEKEGFAGLSRWMNGVRNVLAELQGLSRLFDGLSEQQRVQLFAQLRKLAAVIKQQKDLEKQVKALEATVVTLQEDVVALKEAVETARAEREALQQQVSALEDAQSSGDDVVVEA